MDIVSCFNFDESIDFLKNKLSKDYNKIINNFLNYKKYDIMSYFRIDDYIIFNFGKIYKYDKYIIFANYYNIKITEFIIKNVMINHIMIYI